MKCFGIERPLATRPCVEPAMECWAAFPKCSRANFIVAKPHNDLPGGMWHRQPHSHSYSGLVPSSFSLIRILIKHCSRPEAQDSPGHPDRDIDQAPSNRRPSRRHQTRSAHQLLAPSRHGGLQEFDQCFDIIKLSSNCHAQLASPPQRAGTFTL